MRFPTTTRFLVVGLLAMDYCIAAHSPLRADVKTKAVQEAAESIMARFGAKAGRSLPALAQRIESFAARYGEEALVAVRRVGPEAFTVVEEAGINAPRAVRVLARYGEEGATCVLRRPRAMSQFLRYGDQAAMVLVKHPGIAEPLVEKGGLSAVKALGAVTARDGRRLAMIMDGEIGKLPGSGKLLDVIGQYGQKACDFVWKNKGALAVGATLTAFVTNPEPFLNGTATLAKSVGDVTARPLAEGIARATSWTLVILVVALVGGAIVAFKLGLIRQHAAAQSRGSAMTATQEVRDKEAPRSAEKESRQ